MIRLSYDFGCTLVGLVDSEVTIVLVEICWNSTRTKWSVDVGFAVKNKTNWLRVAEDLASSSLAETFVDEYVRRFEQQELDEHAINALRVLSGG